MKLQGREQRYERIARFGGPGGHVETQQKWLLQ
jgi:hypothetical protein